jgi:hypothetical protein
MKWLKKASRNPQYLHDLVAIYDFEEFAQPTLVKLPVGLGHQLRTEMDSFFTRINARDAKFCGCRKPSKP